MACPHMGESDGSLQASDLAEMIYSWRSGKTTGGLPFCGVTSVMEMMGPNVGLAYSKIIS